MSNGNLQRKTDAPGNPVSPAGKAVYTALTALLVVVFLGVFPLNANSAVFQGEHYMPHFSHYADADQYARLADALIHGRLYLDLPVADELLALDNPYTTADRIDIGSEDVPIYWDHAFYEGKYYSYFGVVPAVLVFAPYQLLTGTWLPTPWAIAFVGALAICAIALFVRRMALVFFPDSATTYSISACLIVFFSGCSFTYLAFVARFYSVPIVSSLLFTALGLWFWLGAKERYLEGGDAAPISHLAAGSLFMALNLGCRPQYILASLLALPLFYREICKSRLLFSRKGMKPTVAALIPFVLVFIPLLAYNYARFGSLTDFGSAYNLTGFDMTEYEQNKRLTIVLFFTYLIQPPEFIGSFPFIAPVPTEHLELGWAPSEPFFGGFFLLKPIMLLALLVPFAFRTLRRKGLAGIVVLCFVLSGVVLLADIRIAGITQRYFSDFGFYASLVAALTLLSLQLQVESRESSVVRRVGIALVALALAVTFILGGLSLFSPLRYDSIADLNPALFESVSALFGGDVSPKEL